MDLSAKEPHELETSTPVLEQRLLILASSIKDGEVASSVLSKANIDCITCKDIHGLMDQLAKGAGAILLVEEVLDAVCKEVLSSYINVQPSWSDLPILMLTYHGAHSPYLDETAERLGNITFLERPVRAASFISAVRSALRARNRQYQVRDSHQLLQESEARFKSLFEHNPDGIVIRDLNGRFISGNKAHEALTGYSAEELRSLTPRSFVMPEQAEQIMHYFQEATKGHPQKFKIKGVKKDGTVIEVEATYLPLIVGGRILGVHGIVRDVTQAKLYERQIEHLANHDSLTGLLNRHSLHDRLEHALARSRRENNQTGVLFMDLNRFKHVNDSLGHDKGDMLLQAVASRLKNSMRDNDTVARLGGDEFVIVIEDMRGIEDMAAIADIVLRTVATPITLDGHELSVTTSIGGSVFPKDGTDVATLLKHADLAMYQAKDLGLGSFRFYDPAMNIKILERLLTENALRRALDNNEFVVHYQPRFCLHNKTVVAVEALVRWMNPERGLVPPVDFIPLAEEIGLINHIGEWVLETACRQNRQWQDAGLPPLKMAVNLSAHQLTSSQINKTVEAVLAKTALEPQFLELEITESSLIQNMDFSLETLMKIRDSGVSISIDDFGTGYSSLTHLKRLPIDTLKIDRSFIHDIMDDTDDAAIVSATIALAHHMELKVIAEGVTTMEEFQLLMQLQCDEMQGYIFSEALPAGQLEPLLKRNEWMTQVGYSA